MAYFRKTGFIIGAGGGGVTPEFNETLLAEDLNNTGTLDFDGANYLDYPLLKIWLYDTDTNEDIYFLVVPASLEKVFDYFSRGVCFGRFYSSKYVYYKPNVSGNWIKGSASNLFCKAVYGITGDNCTINVTNLYRGNSNAYFDQAITYSGDFDFFVAICNVSSNDSEPCEYIMQYSDKIPNCFYANVANGWNSWREIKIDNNTISTYYWFSVDGVKIT